MTTTKVTRDTVAQQAPTALLAVVEHIRDHDLGTPFSIHGPTSIDPYFTIGIPSASLDAWTASGFTADHTAITPSDISCYERISVTGRLLPQSIRVRLSARRRIDKPLTVVPA